MAADIYAESFMSWWASADDRDRKLYEDVLGYEDKYFKDMTLRADSILRDFLYLEVADENGIFQPAALDGPMMASSIANWYYRFKVVDLPKGTQGRISIEDRVIEISPECCESPSVIMHEMIHAYEHALEEVAPFFRDILLFCLHKDLSEKIKDLYSLILRQSHALRAEDVYMEGGSHGVLFFLKSLDIDIRMGLRLGTTFGYGADSEDAPQA